MVLKDLSPVDGAVFCIKPNLKGEKLHTNQHKDEHEQEKEDHKIDRVSKCFGQPPEQVSKRSPLPRQLENPQKPDPPQSRKRSSLIIMGIRMTMILYVLYNSYLDQRNNNQDRIKPVILISTILLKPESK